VKSSPVSDSIVLADEFLAHTGGSASNFAYAARMLGASVSFVGAIGNDPAGKFFLEEIRSYGIDVSFVQVLEGEHTGSASIWIDSSGEKHGVAWRGANLKLSPNNEWKKFDSADIVHLAGCTPSVCNWVIANTSTMKSFDPGSSSKKFSPKQLATMCSKSKVTFVTRGEVERCLADGISLIESTLKGAGILVVKNGALGVEVWSQSEAFKMNALPAEVVDTTGAGDAFAAAFLYRYLETGVVQDACRWANACAALKVGSLGAKSGIPDYKRLRGFVESNGRKMVVSALSLED
ncbi:MAG: carbohydrate kinase family protein, partial [Thermoprotei archaeon]